MRKFRPPGREERLRAIGPMEGLPEGLRRAFEPDTLFAPMTVPEEGSWLDVHPEAGQTYEDYVSSGANRPDSRRRVIYLQPVGLFSPEDSPPLQRLRDYAKAFFCLDARVLPPLGIGTHAFTTRINPLTKKRQILAGDILSFVGKRLEADGFCVLALTMEDLYPDPSWNFVFGQASPRKRAGVYSFARYDPTFYGMQRDPDFRRLLLRRSCKVLAHETGHMFGLEHCIYFRCVMNGSNHLEESDSRPQALCPVCLRKLQFAVRFDPEKRYRALLTFYLRNGFDEEAVWVARRLEKIAKGG